VPALAHKVYLLVTGHIHRSVSSRYNDTNLLAPWLAGKRNAELARELLAGTSPALLADMDQYMTEAGSAVVHVYRASNKENRHGHSNLNPFQGSVAWDA